MKKFGITLVVNGLSLFIISQLFEGINIELSSLIILTLVFCVLNITVKPILKLLSLPITIITLGLFTFFLNGLVLWLALKLVPGASSDGFFVLIIASIILSILNSAFTKLFKDKK